MRYFIIKTIEPDVQGKLYSQYFCSTNINGSPVHTMVTHREDATVYSSIIMLYKIRVMFALKGRRIFRVETPNIDKLVQELHQI